MIIAGIIVLIGIKDKSGAITETSDNLKPLAIRIVDNVIIVAFNNNEIQNIDSVGIIIEPNKISAMDVNIIVINLVENEVIYSSVATAAIFVVILLPDLKKAVKKDKTNPKDIIQIIY
jgi:hypothetical protein